MTYVMQVVRWVLRLPRTVQIAVGLTIVLGGLIALYQHRIAAAEQRGKDSVVVAAARVDTVFQIKLVAAQARVDTAWLRTKAAAARVDTAWLAVPDSIKAIPEVRAAELSCRELDRSCAQLRADVVTERHIADSLYRSLRVQVVAAKDSVKAAQSRGKWATITAALAVVFLVLETLWLWLGAQ